MKGVNCCIWSQEGKVVKGFAVRIFLAASQISHRPFVAVFDGIGETVAPTKTSTFEEDEEFIGLGACLEVECCGGTIQALGGGVVRSEEGEISCVDKDG